MLGRPTITLVATHNHLGMPSLEALDHPTTKSSSNNAYNRVV